MLSPDVFCWYEHLTQIHLILFSFKKLHVSDDTLSDTKSLHHTEGETRNPQVLKSKYDFSVSSSTSKNVI